MHVDRDVPGNVGMDSRTVIARGSILYPEHIPKAEEALAYRRHVAYAVTRIAMRDRIKEAKRAVAAVQGN